MLPLAQIVNANVSFGSARHPASELFAHEEIRMMPQFFPTFYRVVVRKSEEAHAAPAQHSVELDRIAIAFAAKFSGKGGCTGSGKVRVDMKIALHNDKGRRSALQADDTRANLKIIQLLNYLDTQIGTLTFP